MPLPINRLLSTAILTLLFGAGSMLQAQSADSGAHPLVLAQMADDDAGAPMQDDQSSAAALTVRIDRMESTIRSLTGKIEELQFQNRKLTDDLRKMQQDVDFRLQDLEHGTAGGGGPRPVQQKRTEADPPSSAGLPQDASGIDPAAPAMTPAARPARRTGDAFDPDSDPSAPGAPRPLGTSSPSAPLPGRKDSTGNVSAAAQPNAPLDLMKRPATASPVDQSTENGVAPIRSDSPPADATQARSAPNPNSVASLVPGGTRDEYNADLDLYRQGQFDGAATGLKSFVEKYPRDRMVPDAVYLLGETYTKLGRHREAAEQYLRLSTDYSKAPRAPDALLKLGMALNAMGVREQACATYQEVTRRYPTASTDVRAGVDRELKRARC